MKTKQTPADKTMTHRSKRFQRVTWRSTRETITRRALACFPAAVLSPFAALLAFGSNCGRRVDRSSSWAHCSCHYVTDFDQPGSVEVDVCATKGGKTSLAQSCATGAGVGAVTDCTCEEPAKPIACDPSERSCSGQAEEAGGG